jgi:hypothetical protein
MKRFLPVFVYTALLLSSVAACTPVALKRSQTITFAELPPQNLIDSSLQLTATASSGLPVAYSSSDSRIAVVEGDVVQFVSPGTVYIIANQAGDETFNEAPYEKRERRIRDWDTRKLSPTISFELPASRSNDDPPLLLAATASSGLPVRYTSNNSKGSIAGDSLTGIYYLILYHGPMTYDLTLTITASQAGDSIYNPAENVLRTLHAIGDGTH